MLVHHSRLPAWPCSTSDDPYFGPYKILSVDGHRITVRCSLRPGGTLVCAAQHLKRYYDPEDLCGEEWELNDEEIAALDLQGAASPMEVEGELPDMNAEEMAKEGFYLVKYLWWQSPWSRDRSRRKIKNQEDDAPPEKIERKIVFSDLRNPAQKILHRCLARSQIWDTHKKNEQ